MSLAGRLGFEPRQSAPKALDLPLVDRPIPNCLPNKNLAAGVPDERRFCAWRGGKALDLPLVDRQ